MGEILYRISIFGYLCVLYLAQYLHPKARAWVQGRKNLRAQLDKAARQFHAGPGRRVWMHCASLGEFEQGRPLIEALKREEPDCRILLSFFSPSGYNMRHAYPLADAVVYLPADTPRAAKHFVRLFQPDVAVFVKYEFWYQHLRALHEAQVPLLLIAGIFREKQIFFRWYGWLHRRMLGWFDHLFVQDESSLRLLQSHGFQKAELAGDPRIDRVLELREQAPELPELQAFVADAPCLIIGSSWPADEARLLPFLQRHLPPGWVVVLAPHELREAHLQALQAQLGAEAFRYTKRSQTAPAGKRFLILDTIGMLAAAYQYGSIAYIGGGFGKGIHNTLEPAAWGLPLLFGPRYHKFDEARALIAAEAAFSINNTEQLHEAFERLRNPDAYQLAQAGALNYLQTRRGATQYILHTCFFKP